MSYSLDLIHWYGAGRKRDNASVLICVVGRHVATIRIGAANYSRDYYNAADFMFIKALLERRTAEP